MSVISLPQATLPLAGVAVISRRVLVVVALAGRNILPIVNRSNIFPLLAARLHAVFLPEEAQSERKHEFISTQSAWRVES